MAFLGNVLMNLLLMRETQVRVLLLTETMRNRYTHYKTKTSCNVVFPKARLEIHHLSSQKLSSLTLSNSHFYSSSFSQAESNVQEKVIQRRRTATRLSGKISCRSPKDSSELEFEILPIVCKCRILLNKILQIKDKLTPASD